MKRIILCFFLFFSTQAFYQIDQGKWFVFDNYYILGDGGTGQCSNAAQVTEVPGMLTETTNYGTVSCQSQSPNYATGTMQMRSFYWEYGTLKVRAKFSGTGTHNAVWMFGGAAGTNGYPPTCQALVMAKTSNQPVIPCTTSATATYEIDVAEIQPAVDPLTYVNMQLHLWQSGSIYSSLGGGVNVGFDVTQAYHIYELDWLPSQLIFKVDGTTEQTINYAVNVPMFLIIDQSVDTGAPPEASGYYPLSSNYSYVRVCSVVGATCAPGEADMIFDDEFNAGVNAVLNGGTFKGAVVQ
jgi:beta-glucanase (GH16 family)